MRLSIVLAQYTPVRTIFLLANVPGTETYANAQNYLLSKQPKP